MSGSEMIRAALAAEHKSQTWLAQQKGWSKQNLNTRLKNNSLTFDEVCELLAFLGYRAEMLKNNDHVVRAMEGAE